MRFRRSTPFSGSPSWLVGRALTALVGFLRPIAGCFCLGAVRPLSDRLSGLLAPGFGGLVPPVALGVLLGVLPLPGETKELRPPVPGGSRDGWSALGAGDRT